MTASKFTIAWRSFEPELPDVVSESLFTKYKSSDIKDLIKIEFHFWRVFYPQLIVLILGVIFLIGDSFHFFSRNGFLNLIGTLIIILASITLLSFIPSAFSFLSSFRYTKEYLKSLNKFLQESTSYKSFCEKMCEIDKRYIMHINRRRGINS